MTESLIVNTKVKAFLRENFTDGREDITSISAGALEGINAKFTQYLEEVAERTKLDKSKTVQPRHC